MQFKSIARAQRRGHVGVVQSSYFSFMTRRVKSQKKGKTFMSYNSGIPNNSRWFKGNTDPISEAPLTYGKYTFL